MIDLKPILRDQLAAALRADQEQHFAARPGQSVYGVTPDDDRTDALTHDLELIDILIDDAADRLTRREVSRVSEAVSELAKRHGVPVEQHTELAIGLLQVELQVMKEGRNRLLHGAMTPVALASPVNTAPAVPVLANVGLRLSEVLPQFVEFMVQEAGWRGTTLSQNQNTFRMFLEHCGDLPVDQYTRAALASFYDTLRGLPANYSRPPKWRELSARQIVEATKGQDMPRLAMKTIKRHIYTLSGMFQYLKEHGHAVTENPARGFSFPTKGRANAKRKPWQGDALRQLFSSPLFTGSKSKTARWKPGTVLVKDAKYWLPILGIYHGNRLEEFAQLVRGDVRTQDGITYFDINDEGDKQVKNEQSKRRVPIHPLVIQLGFLEYVEAVAHGAGDPLFPDLEPGGADSKRGYTFSKWWPRYRRAIGLYERGLDYHSFRHSVTTKLVEAEVPQAIIDELTGHEGQGTSRSVYTHEMPLTKLFDAVCKIRWPEITLASHGDPQLCP
jgi:integrase